MQDTQLSYGRSG